MSVYSVGNSYTTGGLGSRWQPKESRIRVGRDVAALTSTGFSGKSTNNMVLGHGDDVTLKSGELFQYAKSSAQMGNRVQSFRSLSKAFDQGGGASPLGNAVLASQGDYSVSYDALNGMVHISTKNTQTGEFAITQSIAVKQDMKISWGEDGEPQVLTGSAALTEGVLEAKGRNEVLIRTSDVDVVAGSGTTVVNLSSAAGTFSGGDRVTYLGSYQDSAFTGATGDVHFAGYFFGSTFSELTGNNTFSGVFESTEVDAAKGRNSFSGYFSASAIIGGKERYTASGLFMNGSTVLGSSDGDSFSGRFIDSEVNGGDGDDSFGNAQSLGNPETLVYRSAGDDKKVYSGIAADFVHSTVNTGAGDDSFKGVMWGGTLNLEQGENTVKGVFGQTAVNGGNGNDEVTAVYSDTSIFNTGIGDDSVTLLTSVLSTINTDEGTNIISMGQNNPPAGSATWQNRSDYFSKKRPAETGELQHNTINSEKGENQIAVHNGESAVAALSGDNYTAYTRKNGQAANSSANEDDAVEAAETQEPVALLTERQQAFPQAQQYAAVAQLMQTPEVLRTDASDTAGDTQNGLSERQVRYAHGRYKSFHGFNPLEQGTPAVTVNTADGASQTFKGIARHNEFEDDKTSPNGMVRTVRRAGADGSFSWNRWERVA